MMHVQVRQALEHEQNATKQNCSDNLSLVCQKERILSSYIGLHALLWMLLQLNLMSCFCRNDRLDEEECQQVEFLVFCTSRNVAKAAGEFLKERLVMAADEEIKKASKSKRGETSYNNIIHWIFLQMRITICH